MPEMIFLEGVDRTGKSTLLNEICKQSNYRYIICDRAILSQLAYNNKYSRSHEYDLATYKLFPIVYLTASSDVLLQRFKDTEEPDLYDDIDTKSGIEKDLSLFNEYAAILSSRGYTIWEYDSGKYSAKEIAADVIDKLNKLNHKENC